MALPTNRNKGKHESASIPERSRIVGEVLEIAKASATKVEDEDTVVPEASDGKILDISGSSLQRRIAKVLKLSTFEPRHRYWLDTQSPYLNAALGSKIYGIPYGKMIELRGKNHGGKTTLATIIAGMAQRDGAGIGYIDAEDSRDEDWCRRLSLDYDKVVKIYPKLITNKKSMPPRLQSAEELFAEAEVGMDMLANAGAEKQFWFLDSVANLRPQEMLEKGVMGQNMRTKVGLASFLSSTLPTWVGLAANYNATIVLINQIRTNPGQMFGNPEYSPGGNAFQHTCAVRADVVRLKGGKLRKGERTVGIVGIVRNFKNKAGRRSEQDVVCGYTIRWDKEPAVYKFMDREEAESYLPR